MGASQNFIMMNLTIIFFNVVFGLIMHVMIMSTGVPSVRERYVQLAQDLIINDSQITEDRGVPVLSAKCKGKGHKNHQKSKSQTLYPSIGLLDRSGAFKIHPFAVTPEKTANYTSDSWSVCLSAQTSVNYLYWIPKQVAAWQGPISVAVFTPGVDYSVAIRMIRYLQACYPQVKTRVAFHFSYPKNMPPKYVDSDIDNLEFDCDQPESVNNELLKNLRSGTWETVVKKLAYPQNLLRNLAREGCHADYSFTPDIDMIPNPTMSSQLNNFLSRASTRDCYKCAYVIPIYEIDIRIESNPETKDELLRLLKSKYAQPFHIKVYSKNQGNSNLKRWAKTKGSGKLDVMYSIPKYKDDWEPIYVAKADVPFYDERFVGYGHTRSSQVREMHMANYSFFVLNEAFLSHRGFQTRRMRKSIRITQMQKNDKLYPAFLKEVEARYRYLHVENP